MNPKLKEKLLESLMAVLPITLIVLALYVLFLGKVQVDNLNAALAETGVSGAESAVQASENLGGVLDSANHNYQVLLQAVNGQARISSQTVRSLLG